MAGENGWNLACFAEVLIYVILSDYFSLFYVFSLPDISFSF